ncbi:MAG: chitobiase/beta-hexosaminidase C-terminal domain-containing protein [Prevotella sp.]|nr:chitobiase/beta-hexosaminidase C-terminal domain-containing protein [Prevotella sp.]
MKKIITLTILALTAMLTAATAQTHRRWDFTHWSPATVANLMADAAASSVEGWSDIEKKADAGEGKVAPEATAGKCFWLTDAEGGELKANGEVITELVGLDFGATYTNNRSLAIAIDYPSTALGEYAGPQYLWLGGGGKNMACFTIPNVMVGQKITMTIESHKPSDARGVELYVGSIAAENKIGDSFKPTTLETYTWENWTLPEGIENTGTTDIIVYNTSGCHIYNIEVGEDTGKKRTVALLYGGNAADDLALQTLTADATLDVTPIEATATLLLDDLDNYDAVVLSSTVTDVAAIATLGSLRPFLPMLNLNPLVYEQWGLGQTIETETTFATLTNASHALFAGLELIEDIDPETEQTLYVLPLTNLKTFTAVTLQGLFAGDAVLAYPHQTEGLTAIHAHNMSHNGYLYIPYTQTTLADAVAPAILTNAITLLASSKATVTPAPKPSHSLEYKKLNTVVTLKSGVPSPQIFYTLDGTTPTTESTLYTEPFSVSTALIVKAVVMGDGYPLSEVADIPVDIKDMADSPLIDVAYSGSEAQVTITTTSPGAEVWFNLTGSTSTARSQLYTEPFTLTTNATVTAFVGEYEAFLQSEASTKEVTIAGVQTYSEVISKFEGSTFNSVGNVLNGGYNYYTETVVSSTTLKDIQGGDSIVNTYQPRDSMVVYQLSDDWHVRTFGQGIYYTKATAEHNVGSAKGYNPATVVDDQLGSTEITNNAMQFQVVSKKDLDGRLDPPSVSLESTRAFNGPFEVSIYYSGKDYNTAHVLDILVSTDTLNANSWTKIGELTSLSQPYYDGSSEKSFRVWKRGAAVYSESQPVFVKVASVENAKDVNIFTVLVKAPAAVDDAISSPASVAAAHSATYDLQGRRISGTPQHGLYIRNGKKYYAK